MKIGAGMTVIKAFSTFYDSIKSEIRFELESFVG